MRPDSTNTDPPLAADSTGHEPAEELIDVFDDEGRHLGAMGRTEAHLGGRWHQVAHILVVADRADGPTVILQRRAHTKRTFPGLVDLSATGHLAAGEHPRQGVRELAEELGVDVAPDELFPLGVRRLVDQTPEGLNRELVHVFVVRRDQALVDYRPAIDEVAGVIEVRIEALLQVIDPEPATPRAAPAREWTGTGPAQPIELRAVDLVPEPGLVDVPTVHSHTYWISVLSAGRDYLEGRRPLAV